MPKRCFLDPTDLTLSERERVLARARELRTSKQPPQPSRLRVGALYFNPSLRTRVSFEQAAWLLGAHCQTLNAGADTWKLELDVDATMDGDAVEHGIEAARVLGRCFDVLGIRSFPGTRPWVEERRESLLRLFVENSDASIVSLEGAVHHPCQALADHLTLQDQFGQDLRGLPVVLTWAWHPKPLPMAVPNSFALQAALAGCDLRILRPKGYDLDPEFMQAVRARAADAGGSVRVFDDRFEGLEGAKVVYVKSWGRLDLWEDPRREIQERQALREWTFDQKALEATDSARVMHCLPVRRNVVISGEVLDGPNSIVTAQAENRIWAQAGLLDFLGRSMGRIS